VTLAAIDLTVSVNEVYERVANEDVRAFFSRLALEASDDR
jgi:hypothetical protein